MPHGCKVLPGKLGIAVQGILFFCVIAVLVYKKLKETKRRSWKEFAMDSSKQCFGAGWIHVMNLMCATVEESLMKHGDQCTWYWINIMVDTTLGVAVEYYLLTCLTGLISSAFPASAGDFQSGDYRDPVTQEFILVKYVKQLALWLVVVTGMKLSMLIVMLMFAASLAAVAGFILRPFMNQPVLKLLVVMILTPFCMNAFQFWIVDNFISKHDDCESSAVSPVRIKNPAKKPQNVCIALMCCGYSVYCAVEDAQDIADAEAGNEEARE